MKIKRLFTIILPAFLLFSCTDEGIERPAARIRFNILPERIHPGEYNFSETTYQELAELIYQDSVIIPALREVDIPVNGQTLKIYKDSILVVRTPGSYGNSEHDLVVWQANEERAYRLVVAIYDRLIEFYKQTKGEKENENEISTNEGTTNIQDLTNQLADIEARLERWANNADSIRILEEEKQNIIAQFSQEVETEVASTNNTYETDGTPYVKYYDAERLGLIQMPKRNPK